MADDEAPTGETEGREGAPEGTREGARGEAGAHKPGTPPAGGKKKGLDKLGPHKESIIVGSSVVGVILAWLTLKSIKSGAGTTDSTTGGATLMPSSGGSGGQVAGYAGGGTNTDAMGGLESLLQQFQNQLDSEQTSLAALQAPSAVQQTSALPSAQTPNYFEDVASQTVFVSEGGKVSYLGDVVNGFKAPAGTSMQNIWGYQPFTDAVNSGGFINADALTNDLNARRAAGTG